MDIFREITVRVGGVATFDRGELFDYIAGSVFICSGNKLKLIQLRCVFCAVCQGGKTNEREAYSGLTLRNYIYPRLNNNDRDRMLFAVQMVWEYTRIFKNIKLQYTRISIYHII